MKYIFPAIISLILCGCAMPARKLLSINKNGNALIIPQNRQDPEACEAFIKSLPADTRHGYVNSGEKNIFYYGRWHATPLVIANGGPGGSSWSTYKALQKALDQHNVEYLFFDQKGTGCSSGYPALDERSLSAWNEYGSRGIAADIEAMRAQLRLGEKISIFGHSFGAKIALRYAADYPDSTRSALIYGDSFIDPSNQIANAIANTLERQQKFLSERLANPKLKATLASLSQKYAEAPCARDENNLISACGYPLIRDLGHYYTASNAEQIEGLLFKLDDQATADAALHEIVFKYTHWKLDPQTILLGYLDYQTFVNGQLACELALKKVAIPDWHLNSCAITKSRLSFLNYAKRFVHPEYVTFDLIRNTLMRHSHISVYAFESSADLNNNDFDRKMILPNWTYINLEGSDHFDFYRSKKFWETIKRALQP